MEITLGRYKCPYCTFVTHSFMGLKQHVCWTHLKKCPVCGIYYSHLSAHVFKRALKESKMPGSDGPRPHMVLWFFMLNHNHSTKSWDGALLLQQCKVHAIQACKIP